MHIIHHNNQLHCINNSHTHAHTTHTQWLSLHTLVTKAVMPHYIRAGHTSTSNPLANTIMQPIMPNQYMLSYHGKSFSHQCSILIYTITNNQPSSLVCLSTIQCNIIITAININNHNNTITQCIINTCMHHKHTTNSSVTHTRNQLIIIMVPLSHHQQFNTITQYRH
jgi:hypothetical protein